MKKNNIFYNFLDNFLLFRFIRWIYSKKIQSRFYIRRLVWPYIWHNKNISIYIYVLFLHKKFNLIYLLILLTIIATTNTSCRTKFLKREQDKNNSLFLIQKFYPDGNYVKYTRYWGKGFIALISPILALYFYRNELRF